jgi:hypothetical protein
METKNIPTTYVFQNIRAFLLYYLLNKTLFVRLSQLRPSQPGSHKPVAQCPVIASQLVLSRQLHTVEQLIPNRRWSQT